MFATLGVIAPHKTHLSQQGFHSVADFLALSVEQAQLGQHQECMLADRLGAAGTERQPRRPKNHVQFLCCPATDAPATPSATSPPPPHDNIRGAEYLE